MGLLLAVAGGMGQLPLQAQAQEQARAPGVDAGAEEAEVFEDSYDLGEAQGLLGSGDYAGAVEMVVGALGDGWRGEAWRRVLVEALLANGRYEEAGQAALELAFDERQDLAVLVDMRRVLVKTGMDSDAEDVLEFINRFASVAGEGADDFDARELVALGEAALDLGAEAKFVLEKFFETARRREPELLVGHLAVAELALSKFDYALAAEVLGEAMQHCGDSADLRHALARAFAPSDGDVANAHIARALEINPAHFPTLLLVAGEKIDAEAYGEAKEVLEVVLGNDGHHSGALALRSAVASFENDREAEARFRGHALRYHDDNPEVDHQIGLRFSRRRWFEEGKAAQLRALEMAPDHLGAKLALAMDELRLGDEPAAWALAEEVHAADGYNVLAYNLVKLKDHLASYRTIEADGFVVRMVPEEAEVYGARAVEVLTEARRVLGEKYGLEAEGDTLVEFFPEQQDFAVRTFGVLGGAGILGACFGSVVTMNSPGGAGAMESNWEATLWHEYCHVVTLTVTRNRMPRWLSEGISVHEEGLRDPRWGMRMKREYRDRILAEDADTPLAMSELGRLFSHPDSAEDVMFGYFLSSVAVDYLAERCGEEALRAALGDLANGESVEAAFAKRSGASWDELEEGFRQSAVARARALAPDADWALPEPDDPVRVDPEAAVAFLGENPNNLWALAAVAAHHLSEDRPAEAKELAQRLVGLHPEDTSGSGGYALLARAHRMLGEDAEERAVLERVAERAGDATGAFKRLMETHLEAGRWDDAIARARDYMAVNPLVDDPHRCAGHAHWEAGRPGEAAAAYATLLKLNPVDRPAVHFELARCHEALGDTETAEHHVLESLADSPRFREGHRMLLRLEDAGTVAEPEPPGVPAEVDRVVTVIGEVKANGPVEFQDGMTILEAIAAAGGGTEFAKWSDVGLVRGGRTTTHDLTKLEANPAVDVKLLPGDKIIVRERGASPADPEAPEPAPAAEP